MSYTSPAFMVAHPAEGLALNKIATFLTTDFTDDSKRALIDRRQGETGSFKMVQATGGISLDFGAESGAPTVNCCLIPAGHTFAGEDVVLSSDEVAGFLSPTVQGTQSPTDASLIEYLFSVVSNQSAWAITIPTSSVDDVFALSEWWVGERVEIATADVQPFFEREWVHRVANQVIGGRDLSLELTPPRRRFGLSLRYVDPGSADFAILEDVMRLGVSTPFWYWPPDSTDPGPYLVKLERSATRRQERVAPQVTISYSIDLVMLEQST